MNTQSLVTAVVDSMIAKSMRTPQFSCPDPHGL